MRIHTNTLTPADLAAAVKHAGLKPSNLAFTEHGSRKRARAFNVTLTGTSSRRPNNGTGGRFRDGAGDDDHAATWDEWGMFLGELFERDADVTIPGVYADAADFDYKTAGRFDRLTPAYQHGGSGHRWEFMGTPREQECTTCEAVRRF